MAKRRRSTPRACVRKRVVIKSKRTGKQIASFMAHKGSNCPKRPKPKTGHLRTYKKIFATEARACARSRAVRQRGKWSRKAYNACIKQAMKAATR
jgi:hypothetical protein